MKKQGKPTMLVYSDSPVATTGLGRVSRYLLPHFAKRFDITLVAINHKDVNVTHDGVYANYDKEKYPFIIIPTFQTGDDYGVVGMKNLLTKYKWDYIFTSCDMQRVVPFMDELLKNRQQHGSVWINYTPIDRYSVMSEEIPVFSAPDITVALSDYGKNKFAEHGLETRRIWHPIDASEFPQISNKEVKEFRKEYFKDWKAKDFIVTNVNRNMHRKDVSRGLWSFHNSKLKNGKLYLHMKAQDDDSNLFNTITELEMSMDDVRFPSFEDAAVALSQEMLNLIYRASDVIFTTSTGEGFGFSTVEAMLTGRPFIGPRNTTFPELIGNNGYLVECSDIVWNYNGSNTTREIINKEKLAEQLEYVQNNYNEALEKAQDARRWVLKNLSLRKILSEWDELFDELE